MRLPNDEIVHYKSYNGISFTVERTELVRCKDCKKRNTRTCMMNNNVGMNKDLFDNDFCSYGEKKDE